MTQAAIRASAEDGRAAPGATCHRRGSGLPRVGLEGVARHERIVASTPLDLAGLLRRPGDAAPRSGGAVEDDAATGVEIRPIVIQVEKAAHGREARGRGADEVLVPDREQIVALEEPDGRVAVREAEVDALVEPPGSDGATR